MEKNIVAITNGDEIKFNSTECDINEQPIVPGDKVFSISVNLTANDFKVFIITVNKVLITRTLYTEFNTNNFMVNEEHKYEDCIEKYGEIINRILSKIDEEL